MRTKILPFLGVLLLVGCPGSLEDPERFGLGDPPPGDGGGGGGGGGDACGAAEVQPIFAAKCAGAGCHSAASAAAGLDLESEGIGPRLLDGATGCNDLLMINSADPGASYLTEKLYDSPTCGSKMPLIGGALDDTELDCVESWVQAVASAGAP